MRVDNPAFTAKNLAKAKLPRYAIVVSFDSENTVLHCFTSHADAATPPGVSVIPGVVKKISGTSQRLNPDTANATIGSTSFELVDRAGIVTQTLGDQLVLGRSTRRQRVQFYKGFEGLPWASYVLVQTQLITNISLDETVYRFSCSDVQREVRKEIFDLATTRLTAPVGLNDTVINVVSTAGFEAVAHGSSYSDAPGATVWYIKLQAEVIRCNTKTPTSFGGAQRGALNTRPAEHTIDPSAPEDQRTEVQEYVYLELPAIDLMYRLLTGKDQFGNSVMPARWHLGIPTSYVRLADFTGIGSDLFDTADATQGLIPRFEDLEKTDGKKFIETELAQLAGVFMPVYADGALGLKRMANILAGAAYTVLLDETNLVSWGELKHDFEALRNLLQISWNWEPEQEKFTRVNGLADGDSHTRHKEAEPLKLAFRGLHGSRHTAAILAQRFDALRDRYSSPPLVISVRVIPSLNTIEVGDVVRLKPPGVRDFNANGVSDRPLDRSFEVRHVAVDWVTGEVNLELFASSAAPGAIAPTADSAVLPESWYTGQGTPLSDVLTITGANPGHVTGGGTLTAVAGDSNHADSIYYYIGDLVIDQGVTIELENTPQLRVRGHVQNNGRIDGKGRGLAGAEALSYAEEPTVPLVSNPGTAGFIGTTSAGGGLDSAFREEFWRGAPQPPFMNPILKAGGGVVGQNTVMPPFNLSWKGGVLGLRLPADLRGTSGSSGGHFAEGHTSFVTKYYPGGKGGDGGAGLIIVSRGFANGAAGVIDLSGDDGELATPFVEQPIPVTNHLTGPVTHYPGSGAGGAPGGLLIVLDGALTSATGLTDTGFVALQGNTPIPPNVTFIRPGDLQPAAGAVYSFYVGTGDGTTFPLPSLSNARGGSRVQYVPNNTAPGDAVPGLPVTLTAPSNLGFTAGNDQLLRQGDGTILTRVLLEWTPSTDPRTDGYEIQMKPSGESIWQPAALVLGALSDETLVGGVADGRDYDFRIRAVGDPRLISNWLTLVDCFIEGKSAEPTDVSIFTIEGRRLSWVHVDDPDGAGYRIKVQPGQLRDWGTASALFNGKTQVSPVDIPADVTGPSCFLIKQVDTSGNESQNAAVIITDLGDPVIANAVETLDRKAAGFPGTKTGCTVSGGNLVADIINSPLMWNPNGATNMWSVNGSTLMWATEQYAAMEYIETFSFRDLLPGTKLKIDHEIQGESWRIEWRENSHKLGWSGDDSRAGWNVDPDTPGWDNPPWQAFLGAIEPRDRSIYEFRVSADQSTAVRGMVSKLDFIIDFPDVSELIDDAAILATGTRLQIQKSYRKIKNVKLTLQADGGGATRVRVLDKSAELGPFIAADNAGTPASATVDAHVHGY